MFVILNLKTIAFFYFQGFTCNCKQMQLLSFVFLLTIAATNKQYKI